MTDHDEEHVLQPQPSNPTARGPADWFTGDVWIDPIVQPQGESQLNIGAVHFMTHISITQGPPTWGDHPTDDDYPGPTG